MPTFKITLAYDGTDFVGWQRQASGPSIQGLIEEALAELDGREVAVAGPAGPMPASTRSDRWRVHARARDLTPARCVAR